ncbi:MAG: hypothetical protein U5L01_12710 [Rheinheimera sp.]|nr:hypothetical protein [Rheinheimera sp.]
MTTNQSLAKGNVVIVDTGCANITSVFCAFERLGADVSISADVNVIRAASKVVIPGVGTRSASHGQHQYQGFTGSIATADTTDLRYLFGYATDDRTQFGKSNAGRLSK